MPDQLNKAEVTIDISLRETGKYDSLTSLRNSRMSQVRGAGLIVSGLNHRRDLRKPYAICANGLMAICTAKEMQSINVGQQWNAKTPPLKVFGGPISGPGRFRPSLKSRFPALHPLRVATRSRERVTP